MVKYVITVADLDGVKITCFSKEEAIKTFGIAVRQYHKRNCLFAFLTYTEYLTAYKNCGRLLDFDEWIKNTHIVKCRKECD